MTIMLNIELDFKSKHGASATLVIRNLNLPSNTTCICRNYIKIIAYCLLAVQISWLMLHLMILVFRPKTLLKRDSKTGVFQ